jgi:transposase InsO family protein
VYKTELIERHRRTWTAQQRSKPKSPAGCIWFNADRLHSSINYNPPITYEQQYRQTSAPTGDAA